MKVGINTLVLGGQPWTIDDAVFARLKAIGFDGVELPVFEGRPADYADLGRRLDAIGLERTFVTIVPDEASSPISQDSQARERAKTRLEWALECGRELGATLMAGPWHSPLGVFSGNGPTEDELSWLADIHRHVAEHAQNAGIALSLEAVNRFECYALNTMRQAAEHARRVDHPHFNFMYDTFHANIEEQDPIGAFTEHRQWINHIHISENDRGIPGRGHIDFAAIISTIRQSGYDGWLTVEAFGRAIPALAAATRVWRDLFPDIDTLFVESHDLIRRHWDAAG